MKLTKKIESEIKALMDDYWSSYLRGDIKYWSRYLVSDYRNIGGTEEEIWNSKKEILDYTYRVIEQMVGKAEIRNKKIQIIPYDPYVMAHEFMDLFIKVGGKWTFYGKFRLSSLIQKINGAWKVLHQHGSYPDSHTEEGEAFAFDKLRKENTELREAVQRRTVELEDKNHELEIETAMEKVRAVAMGMKEPADMLEVCKVISEQLQKFKVKDLRNIQTAIISESKGTYLNYEYFTRYRKTTVSEIEINLHPTVKEFAKQILKSKDAFFIKSIKGKALASWRQFRKKSKQIPDPVLDKANAVYYNFYSIGPGAIGISTYSPLSKENLALFERFTNVFKLAYSRFTDIQLAMAQAREAKIEVALERVRARTMAMQKSDELPETSYLLFQQLKELGETAAQLSIGIMKPENGFVELSATLHGSQLLQTYQVPIDEPFMMKKAVRAWKAKKKSLLITLEGKELKAYNNWRKSFLKKKFDFPEKQWIVHMTFFSKGLLSFSSEKKLTNETLQLLERFAGVFDGTYTRFLDLQKAEAQARESQIELGLERVRARAMAMQKSDELSELVDTVFKELTKLDFALTWCIINIIDESSMSNMVWAASPEIDKAPDSYHMKFEDYPFHHAMMKGWKERKPKHVYVLEGREKKVYDEYLFNETEFRKVPKEAQAASKAMKKYVVTFSFSNFGGLQTVGEEPLSDANLDILSRFGKVFDLTYTRFNDLKQAEAQARESQIQLALERVRARTMAMQRSEDMLEAASLLFKQIADLGTTSWSSGFIIFQLEDLTINSWMSKPDGSMGVPFNIPLTQDPFFINIYEAYKRGEEFFVMESGGKELAETYRYMFGLPGASKALGAIEDIGFQMPGFQITHCAFFPQGFLMFITYEPCQEMWDIFKRFGKVFEQTYTRFLDLQKAEAQAREAKIEAALEKVRSRSLAMHKSEELQEVVNTVFERLKELEIDMNVASIFIFKEGAKDWEQWVATSTTDYSSFFNIPYVNLPVFRDLEEAKQKGIDFYSVRYSFEQKKEWFSYAFKNTEYRQVPADRKKYILNSEFFLVSFALARHSGIQIAKYEGRDFSPEENDILKRFSRIFEQVYIRFLDLQKAEAQAKEAQIEAALERVRSRSMGMQKSEELKEVIQVVYDQFFHLNILVEHTGFIIDYKARDDMHIWLADQHEVPSEVIIPWFDSPPNNSIKEAKEKGLDFFKYLLTFEEKNKFYRDLFKIIPDVPEETLEYYFNCPGLAGSGVLLDNIGLYIENFSAIPYTDDENSVLMRFGRVFQQTYTRFLDLQKAEAQAREAHIETALERVRAKAMAMHSSKDLSETLTVFYGQLKSLGVTPRRCGIAIMNKDEHLAEVTTMNTTEQGDSIELIGHIEMSGHKILDDVYENWLAQKEYHASLKGNEIKEYYQVLRPQISVPDYPHDVVQYGYYFMFKEGDVYTWTEKELTEDELKIYRKFTTVVSLTYKRYKDLQQAEAQAREAQIEAALEKVRSRSLGMHKSEELQEVVNSVVERFKELKLDFDAANILIFDESNKDLEMWTATTETSYSTRFLIPYSPFEYFQRIAVARNAGKDVFTLYYSFEEKNEFFDFLFRETNFNKLPEERKKFIYECPCMSLNIALIKNVGIQIISYSRDSFSLEEAEVLNRFTKVFDQAYTRFLDLQKAEEQVREAQIEAALERVRSRAMAMHKTNELFDAADIVNKELSSLGVPSMNISYAFIDKGEKSASYYGPNPVDGKISATPFSFPHTETDVMSSILTSWKKQEPFGIIELDKDATIKHQTWVGKYIQYWMEKNKIDTRFSIEEFLAISPETAVIYSFNFKYGYLFIIGEEHLSMEQEQMLPRFTRGFELAYRRFLDLTQAEAQAREAQIEASLERVRSKTMAMHNSEGVGETVSTLFDELIKLGIEDTIRCGIGIMQDNYQMEAWTARPKPGGPAQLIIGRMDMSLHPLLKGAYDGWKNKEEAFSYSLSGRDVIDYYTVLNNQPGWPMKYDLKSLHPNLFHNDFYFPEGGLYTFSNEELPEEAKRIFKRFAAVFGQTYRRYLDLQKAEAQAREAQIELSLERVRARAMAMHKSEELVSASDILFQEMKNLGIESLRTGIGIIDPNNRAIEIWSRSELSGNQSENTILGSVPVTGHPFWKGYYKAWEQKKTAFSYELMGHDVRKFYEYNSSFLSYPERKGFNPQEFISAFFFPEGALNVIGSRPLSDDEGKIMLRFARVFGLTYKRFLDLKKAEAQAREAQIEASLERVRSKTMAMHSSDDVGDTVATMFDEFVRLDIHTHRCGILIFSDEPACEVWTAKSNPEGKANLIIGNLDLTVHALLHGIHKAWKKKEHFYTYSLEGDDLRNYYQTLNELENYPVKFDMNALPSKEVHSGFYFPEGSVFTFTTEPLPDESSRVIRRFAAVFGQTYRRYLDLQKAEAQAREATIETALEKVRGKAMAMHNSGDVLSTASMVFAEIRQLGIQSIRCGVGLLTKNNRYARMYAATTSGENNSLSMMGEVELSGHPCYDKQYEAFLSGKDYYGMLEGEELKSYYDVFRKKLSALPAEAGIIGKEYCYYLPFSEGILYSWSNRAYTDNEINILNRFKSIIDLTFRRYLELQQSEANARDAVKQAALDRVRADIASMRTKSDLDRITPLIWNELNILGIPFIRCGVFIMDEEQEVMHTFLSTPEGKAIAAFHLPYTIRPNINEVHLHWKNAESYVDHWDDQVMNDFSEILYNRGAVPSKEQYLASLPIEGFYLQFLPFLQGMLYVGSLQKLSHEEMNLIQSVADAFSTAYARYEDFNKLEAAKKQVDNTLTDLKQTQQQLVQSEKMASLGELTAGIAHEIQNPLNFVNNFSEVSNELMDEMNAEIEKGDLKEAKAIAGDIKQNLEKINHHGKRADAIVKGMLQHSRSSSGQKEPTDINALADEYLRLAYHGLRAKDKSFNATMKTEFDENIGKINIIPQDIGRVILNLITNAFYAASTQAANFAPLPPQGGFQNPQIKHDPTVWVSTKKVDDKVFISVKDNGPGIPEKVLDKIFQPFFTTKPTGQGTGLGLSLSYDIVKAHGGEIKVVTKEARPDDPVGRGEGSEFIIQLPV